MRILFIELKLPYLLKDSNYPAGGYAVELSNWLQGLTGHGCHCGVLTWIGAADYIARELPFTLIDNYPDNKGIPILKFFYRHIPALLSIAKQFQPDVIVQAVSGKQTGMMAYVATQLKIPFVYRVASDFDVDERHQKMMPWYARVAYQYGLKNTSAIICQNQYQYMKIKSKFPGKPVYILHNPLVTINNITLRKRPEKKYIAWLGNFSYAKNLGLLLQVAQALPDCLFKIGGMETKGIDSDTEAALAKLKQLSNVSFAGYVDRNNIGDFLARAVGLLNTSHFEGFSNTFLEALACGTPIVCPARVDPDTIIASHKLGYTSDNDDLLPVRIKKLLELGDTEHNTLSRRCREYVIQHHDLTGQSRKFIEILSSISLQETV